MPGFAGMAGTADKGLKLLSPLGEKPGSVLGNAFPALI
jgi:hypothetical protein